MPHFPPVSFLATTLLLPCFSSLLHALLLSVCPLIPAGKNKLNSHLFLSELIKLQNGWFRVCFLYWSLTIPLNGSEGWGNLSGCRSWRRSLDSCSWAKIFLGHLGTLGFSKEASLLDFHPLLILIVPAQSFLVAWLCIPSILPYAEHLSQVSQYS